jgi:MoaA/NifB/PqqE/SkfB family radical SAM enzyme
MCDIWKANSEKREISIDDLQKHLQYFQKLGVKRVALSGGEALLHSNLWAFCDALRKIGIKISLLSTGVTLKNHAANVVRYCDDVIVSLDGSPEVHNQIRNIPHAYEKLSEGVMAIREIDPLFRVTGRTVIQKSNFRDFERILKTAYELGLKEISFLPADISSSAFNRAEPWQNDRVEQVALNLEEAEELKKIIRDSINKFEELYLNGFIAEGPEKMLQIPQHYKAVWGKAKYPRRKCNAPWVSAVIESNGDVLPCFFHKAYGNIHEHNFEKIINSEKAIQFRKQLDIAKNETCQRCVCALHIPFYKSA